MVPIFMVPEFLPCLKIGLAQLFYTSKQKVQLDFLAIKREDQKSFLLLILTSEAGAGAHIIP